MSTKDKKPKLPFLHMFTNKEGQSQVDHKFLEDFTQKSVGGKADPQWMLSFPGKVADVKFAVLPAGWIGDWHDSPAKQWVIPITGRWFIETLDGERIEMGPGEIHFGEDLETTEVDGNNGHKSGTVGDEPCHMMIVQFEEVPEDKLKKLFKVSDK